MEKIVIIGAGIVGASAAYLLSKENVEVTLIDSNEPDKQVEQLLESFVHGFLKDEISIGMN